MELNQIQIAALMHDIGKFYQRTGKKHSSVYDNSQKDFGRNGAHGKWSADFVKEIWGDDVEDLVLYHHNPDKSNNPEVAKIIQKADHHSSKERETDDKNFKANKEPLISVFSRIKLIKNQENHEYFLPIRELSLNSEFDDIKPVPSKKVSLDYKTLWSSFSNELKFLKEYNNISFDSTLSLLKKYTSNMPSAAFVSKPDISLYDHSKTTAAIATCRFLYHEESKTTGNRLEQTDDQNCYLAIKGDLSGIQKFIFKINSPQEAQSGMSQRLRGRSLFISLLTDGIATEIINQLELSSANILFCGGGQFTILAPNTIDSKNKLKNIQNEINEYFIKKFNAELYLAIASVECVGEDLENFGKCTVELQNQLNINKNTKFQDNLHEIFQIEKTVVYDDTCPICGNGIQNKGNNQENEFKVCDECSRHSKLGQFSTNSRYLIKISNNERFYDDETFFIMKPLNIAYRFEDSINTDKIKEYSKYSKVEIIKLNNTDVFADEKIREFIKSNQIKNISFSFSFLGNIIPKYYSNDLKTTLYFEHLAKISTGADKLGILKMDVDNLGKVFSHGLKHIKQKDRNGNIVKDKDGNEISVGPSISRISTLSSQMDLFFSGVINEIAKNYRVFQSVCSKCEDKIDKENPILLKTQEKDEKDFKTFKVYKEINDEICKACSEESIPTIHINYSGGDDLLVIGPYDDIIEFANKFRDKFRQWTCKNDSITLSAGINIINSKFPIGKAVIQAEEFLESSKNSGKDKISVFNEVVQWESDYNYSSFSGKYKRKGLLDFAKDLEKYVQLERKNPKKISRGFLYTMLNLWEKYFLNSNLNFFESFNSEMHWKEDYIKRFHNKKFIPMFKYKLISMKGDRLTEDEKKFVETFYKEGQKFMPWIRIPVSWASLKTRD